MLRRMTHTPSINKNGTQGERGKTEPGDSSTLPGNVFNH